MSSTYKYKDDDDSELPKFKYKKPVTDEAFENSIIIGALTDSAIAGAILGGDIIGGIVGDLLNDNE